MARCRVCRMFDFSDQNTPKNFKKKSPAAAPADREAGGLGNTVKSVGQISRNRRFKHQRHAAKLLGGTHKVGLCKWSISKMANGVKVQVKSHESGGRTAYYEGLQTCASVWVCPCCSAKISNQRRAEMNQLLSWARAKGFKVFMVTLTARHGIDDELKPLLEAMKIAKKKLHQHRSWKDLKPWLVGSVTATEVTGGGANGWHPHFHMIVIMGNDEGVQEMLEGLREPWLASLKGAGLSGNGAAFDVRDASAAQSYITKWGAAEELTMTSQKKGKAAGGRTPAQLLADSCDLNDGLAGRLWVEFTQAFHGRRQLVWSRGLKTEAGISEVSDEEAGVSEIETLADITPEIWSGPTKARNRRAAILNTAENTPTDLSDVICDVGKTDADYEAEDGDPLIEVKTQIQMRDVSTEIGRGPEPQPERRGEDRTAFMLMRPSSGSHLPAPCDDPLRSSQGCHVANVPEGSP